jgi:hypothetical protein
MPAPSKKPQRKPVGLTAIRQAREDRAAKRVRMTPGVGYIGAAVVIATAVAYKCVGDRSLNLGKEKLLGRQKDAVALVGPDWFPLRDAIESETMAAAKEWTGDYVDPTTVDWDFRSMAGIYLRLRQVDARDVAGIRTAAQQANKDGFTGCFVHVTNEPLMRGVPDASAFAEQPWTMGQAYEATDVLTDAWAAEVRDAPNTVRVDVLKEQLDKAENDGLPLAGRIVKQAKYLLLVVDEDVPEASAISDGGITEATLQLVPHPSRVYVLDLTTKKERLRVRKTGEATFMGQGDVDPDRHDAMQRQVNNCALARRVEEAMPTTPAK